jgi:hypothetical protein
MLSLKMMSGKARKTTSLADGHNEHENDVRSTSPIEGALTESRRVSVGSSNMPSPSLMISNPLFQSSLIGGRPSSKSSTFDWAMSPSRASPVEFIDRVKEGFSSLALKSPLLKSAISPSLPIGHTLDDGGKDSPRNQKVGYNNANSQEYNRQLEVCDKRLFEVCALIHSMYATPSGDGGSSDCAAAARGSFRSKGVTRTSSSHSSAYSEDSVSSEEAHSRSARWASIKGDGRIASSPPDEKVDFRKYVSSPRRSRLSSHEPQADDSFFKKFSPSSSFDLSSSGPLMLPPRSSTLSNSMLNRATRGAALVRDKEISRRQPLASPTGRERRPPPISPTITSTSSTGSGGTSQSPLWPVNDQQVDSAERIESPGMTPIEPAQHEDTSLKEPAMTAPNHHVFEKTNSRKLLPSPQAEAKDPGWRNLGSFSLGQSTRAVSGSGSSKSDDDSRMSPLRTPASPTSGGGGIPGGDVVVKVLYDLACTAVATREVRETRYLLESLQVFKNSGEVYERMAILLKEKLGLLLDIEEQRFMVASEHKPSESPNTNRNNLTEIDDVVGSFSSSAHSVFSDAGSRRSRAGQKKRMMMLGLLSDSGISIPSSPSRNPASPPRNSTDLKASNFGSVMFQDSSRFSSPSPVQGQSEIVDEKETNLEGAFRTDEPSIGIEIFDDIRRRSLSPRRRVQDQETKAARAGRMATTKVESPYNLNGTRAADPGDAVSRPNPSKELGQEAESLPNPLNEADDKTRAFFKPSTTSPSASSKDDAGSDGHLKGMSLDSSITSRVYTSNNQGEKGETRAGVQLDRFHEDLMGSRAKTWDSLSKFHVDGVALPERTIQSRESLNVQQFECLVDKVNVIAHPAPTRSNSASKAKADPKADEPSLSVVLGIQDFEIVKPISKGAFGVVYLCKHKPTGEFFAVKVLKKADVRRKNQFNCVNAEKKIMAAVDCPFVVKLVCSFQTRKNLYLVMEYVQVSMLEILEVFHIKSSFRPCN